MKVVNKAYNVLDIDLGTIGTSGTTIIGTTLDYEVFRKICSKSGVVKITAMRGTTPIKCTALIRLLDIGMKAWGITDVSGVDKEITFIFATNSNGMWVGSSIAS